MPVIESKHIILRPIRAGDLDTIIELTRQYPDMDDHFPMSLLTELIVKKHFEPDGPVDPVDPVEPVNPGSGQAGEEAASIENGCFLITDKAGEILGCIAYFKIPQHEHEPGLELAYHIFRPAHRGKGIMSEALRLTAVYLFETGNVPRLQIRIVQDNHDSRRVAEACGFAHEGQAEGIDTFTLLREQWATD